MPAPQPLTYAVLAPNLERVDVVGATVNVSWQCAATRAHVGASSAVMTPATTIRSAVTANMQRTALQEGSMWLMRVVNQVLGGSLGRIINSGTAVATGAASAKLASAAAYPASSQEAAVVAAFRTVRDSFQWDDARGAFVARVAGSSLGHPN